MMFYILQQQQIRIFEKIVEKLCKVAVVNQLTIIFTAMVNAFDPVKWNKR